jgi:hypothetical protein
MYDRNLGVPLLRSLLIIIIQAPNAHVHVRFWPARVVPNVREQYRQGVKHARVFLALQNMRLGGALFSLPCVLISLVSA